MAPAPRSWNSCLSTAQTGNVEITRRLLDHGADIDAAPGAHIVDSLVQAAKEKRFYAIEYLRAAGYSESDILEDPERSEDEMLAFAFHGFEGVTPLWVAAEDGEHEMVKLLIQRGANIEAKGSMNHSPLSTAALKGNDEVVEILFEAGADLEARDDGCRLTPLMWAAFNGQLPMMKLLAAAGADVHALDPNETNSLHQASGGYGSPSVIKELLDLGLEVDGRDGRGLTPLHHAAVADRSETVRTLLEAGADINAASDNGTTPLI